MNSTASDIPPQEAGQSEQSAEWVRTPERSNLTMLGIMTWISLHLGRAPARFILVGISLYFLAFTPAAKVASRAYLRRALGRKPNISDLFRHFHSFASTIHDRIFLLNGRFDLFQIDVEGEDLIRTAAANGQGVFLMGAHMGSFEAVRATGRRQSTLRVGMVMYEDNAQKINAALSSINPTAVQDIIPLGRLDSMLQVQGCLDQGMALGILADRDLGDSPTLSVPFLGEPAEFPLGPMRLAAMLNRPVLFMTGLYLGGNRYAIHYEPIADFTHVARADRDAAIRGAVAAYAACLERHCRNAPYNWFNFFDFWRTKSPPV